MGIHTKISWCDHTFNSWRGCARKSEGCRFCFAEATSHRNPKVFGTWGPNGTRVVAAESMWRQPIAWDKAASKDGVRRRVFCGSLMDVFEDFQGRMVKPNGLPLIRGDRQECLTSAVAGEPWMMADVRFDLLNLIRRTPNLDWLLLTKRPENANRMMREFLGAWEIAFLPNVWLGVSVENQAAADERIPALLDIPARVRFLSCEPLLGPLRLRTDIHQVPLGNRAGPPTVQYADRGTSLEGIHQVIVGGESGTKARPFDLAWARAIRDQCQAAGVKYFFKQMGRRPYVGDGRGVYDDHTYYESHDSHGADPSEWPSDLRIQEFPCARAKA